MTSESYVDVAAVAVYLSVAPGWVYDHADELGAFRLGNGRRARLRFRLSEVDARLSTCSSSRESDSHEPASRVASPAGRRPALGTSVELLPIRGRIPHV